MTDTVKIRFLNSESDVDPRLHPRIIEDCSAATQLKYGSCIAYWVDDNINFFRPLSDPVRQANFLGAIKYALGTLAEGVGLATAFIVAVKIKQYLGYVLNFSLSS